MDGFPGKESRSIGKLGNRQASAAAKSGCAAATGRVEAMQVPASR
jgi:hypothetical protein